MNNDECFKQFYLSMNSLETEMIGEKLNLQTPENLFIWGFSRSVDQLGSNS